MTQERSEAPVQPRPLNSDVEQAWKSYALSYELWQETAAKAASNTGNPEYVVALEQMARSRDSALFYYFEVFDADQREAFPDG